MGQHGPDQGRLSSAAPPPVDPTQDASPALRTLLAGNFRRARELDADVRARLAPDRLIVLLTVVAAIAFVAVLVATRGAFVG